ncbi:recombinase family protein [Bacillus pinisoli]|uniref:recombinase family protein n=1 Tax=Bacillus pinisoli TaxID=2901866 RepID=UPI001FF19D57|nr:recombinase family protein [Bacillus pinisoli]
MYRPQELDVFIYLRKSRKDLDEEKRAYEEGRGYDTLERHRRQLFELAKKERHNIIDIFEEVVSGEFISERPQMQNLLREVESGIANAVLVMDLDRLGRGDMVDQGTIYRVFRYSETFIITPTEVIDPTEDNQELNFSIKSLIAREELKTIVKRMQNGRRTSAKEGKSISKVPPYGYLRDQNLRLYPDPETRWVIELIFDLVIQGHGRQAIAQELDKLGVTPPRGNFWSPSTISFIIKNEVYTGKIIWGKYKYTKQHGQYIKRKVPKSKWQVAENAHKSIINTEKFERANELHSNRWRPPTHKTKKLSNPLAGLLVCELCGRVLAFQPRKDRPQPQIRCINPGCKGIQKGASLGLVEERILVGLEDIISQLEITEEMVPKKKKKLTVEVKEKALKVKQKELDELNDQKDKLHDLLEKGVYDVDTFLVRQQAISERIKKGQNELNHLEESLMKERQQVQNQAILLPKMKNVLETYRKTNNVEKKNRLLKSIFEKITYLRKKEWKDKDHFQIQLYTNI